MKRFARCCYKIPVALFFALPLRLATWFFYGYDVGLQDLIDYALDRP